MLFCSGVSIVITYTFHKMHDSDPQVFFSHQELYILKGTKIMFTPLIELDRIQSFCQCLILLEISPLQGDVNLCGLSSASPLTNNKTNPQGHIITQHQSHDSISVSLMTGIMGGADTTINNPTWHIYILLFLAESFIVGCVVFAEQTEFKPKRNGGKGGGMLSMWTQPSDPLNSQLSKY